MDALPDVMHAVLLTGHGGLDQLVYRDDVPVPAPGPGDVVIEVRAAGVNNTDINTRVGWYGSGGWAGAIPFPRIQGADVCGVVVAVGLGVDAARLGRRVLVQSCLRSLAYDGPAPWLGSEVDGGFAQFVRAPSADTYDVECGLSDVQLGAVPCAYATAENLLGRSRVAAGERVLVTGASGGVGVAAVQLARLRGADVIALAGVEKAAAVDALGAGHVLPRDADLTAAIGRDAVDVVIDVVGGPGWPVLLDVLRPGGRYAASGAIAGPVVELDLRTLYLKDLTLFGCTTQDAGVFERLVAALETGDLVPAVAATYPLSEIAAAQEAFTAKRGVGKIVLIPPAPR